MRYHHHPQVILYCWQESQTFCMWMPFRSQIISPNIPALSIQNTQNCIFVRFFLRLLFVQKNIYNLKDYTLRNKEGTKTVQIIYTIYEKKAHRHVLQDQFKMKILLNLYDFLSSVEYKMRACKIFFHAITKNGGWTVSGKYILSHYSIVNSSVPLSTETR